MELDFHSFSMVFPHFIHTLNTLWNTLVFSSVNPVQYFVFELFGGKRCLTVMTLDNSKHCHLEQILISLELSRYPGLTAFTLGILDKGKFKQSLY